MMIKPFKNGSNNLLKVLYIAFSFMVLFSAYSVAQAFISPLYKNLGFSNLGQICIFTLYFAHTIGNVIVPHFKNRLSAKTGLVLGSSTYVLFIMCGAFTVYCKRNDFNSPICSPSFIYPLNILFSILIGLGASVLWQYQSVYVNDCADETNQGRCHGTFFSIMLCSLLIGSAMSAIILGYTDEFTFFIIISLISASSIILFVFLPSVASKQIDNTQGNKIPLMESVIKLYYLSRDSVYYPVSASSFLGGLTFGIFITYFPILVKSTIFAESDNIVNQKISFSLIVFAFGQIMAGFSIGSLLDKFPKVKVGNYIFALTDLVTILSLFTSFTESYMLIFITGFLWGVNDSSVKTFCNTLISSNYGGKFEVFALGRTTQCLGIVFGSLFTILFADAFGKFYMFFIFSWQITCHIAYYLTSQGKQSKKLNIELLERLKSSDP